MAGPDPDPLGSTVTSKKKGIRPSLRCATGTGTWSHFASFDKFNNSHGVRASISTDTKVRYRVSDFREVFEEFFGKHKENNRSRLHPKIRTSIKSFPDSGAVVCLGFSENFSKNSQKSTATSIELLCPSEMRSRFKKN
jgi:hypothetical protein